MTIKRYGMAVRIKEDQKELYIRNHQNVWPEILSELKKIKISNYSIYLKGEFLFGYLEYEGDNFNKDMEEMASIPIVKKWQTLSISCFNPFPGNEENDSWVLMDEIFYMK